MYTGEELREVRDTLAGKRRLSNQEIELLRNEFRDKQIPNYMYPFVGIFATNPDLYRKISEEERVQKYSFFGFFPETFDLVYGSEVSPEISFDGGNRGLVVIIKHPTKKVVVKPTQNSREQEVAQIADELEIGPKQYTSIDGFLTEQFVEGELFSRLRGDRTSADKVYHLGRRMGEILSKDEILKSHKIVLKEKNSCRKASSARLNMRRRARASRRSLVRTSWPTAGTRARSSRTTSIL